MLDGDAIAVVGKVTVAIDKVADDIHGNMGTLLEGVAAKEMPDKDGRENVTGAVKGDRYLVVIEFEVRALVEVLAEARERLVTAAADDAAAAVDAGAGDDDGLSSELRDAVEQPAGLVPAETFGTVRYAGKVAGFSIIR